MNSTEHNGGQAQWLVVSTFATVFEADLARQSLEAEGIPVLVSSNAPGVFGAGYQGGVTGGVSLSVPSPVAEHARALLDGNVIEDEDEYTP